MENKPLLSRVTYPIILNKEQILNTDLSKVSSFMANKAHRGISLTEGHLGFAGHNDPVAYRRSN